MKKNELKNYQMPDTPGVYFFLGERKKILYIGKATSLKNRVNSYFTSDIHEKRSELIARMVREAESLEWRATDSVLEALILETNLIRTHKPLYNTRSKDDKSYNHLVITNEKFPRVLVVRGRDLTEKFEEREIKYTFGPFPNSKLFREALKIVQKLFRFYDTKRPLGKERSKLARGLIDFNRQIGLFPDNKEKNEYTKTIRHIRLFFEGKKKQVIAELERDMRAFAKKQEFEKANECKKKIFALNHIQDVALIRDDRQSVEQDSSLRIEAYDVAHLSGTDMVGVMVVVQNGVPLKSAYRKFKIDSLQKANDTAALYEVLRRRLKHTEWGLPGIIVVDGSTAQKNVAKRTIEEFGYGILVAAVVKDERHKPKKLIMPPHVPVTYKNSILLANAEAHRFAVEYHRTKRSKQYKKKK